MKRLVTLLALVLAAGTASLVGGAVTPAYADACNAGGEWPNCATQCAVTGNNCDYESDGDVDYGWMCANYGTNCGDGGGGGGGGGCSAGQTPVRVPDGRIYTYDEDGAYHQIPDGDTASAIGVNTAAAVNCDTLPAAVGDAWPSVDASPDLYMDWTDGAQYGYGPPGYPGIPVWPGIAVSPSIFKSAPDPVCTSGFFGPINYNAKIVSGWVTILCGRTYHIDGVVSLYRNGALRASRSFSKGGSEMEQGISAVCTGTNNWTIEVLYTATGPGGQRSWGNARTQTVTCG